MAIKANNCTQFCLLLDNDEYDLSSHIQTEDSLFFLLIAALQLTCLIIHYNWQNNYYLRKKYNYKTKTT